MEDGLLSLKWNNHKSTFFHILSSLRKKETYTDATLACDGRFFPVHKLVMSTCSDYFCEVFENTNCKSPVVILKDIKPGDLESLLDYMYLGEVDVKQNELAGLIKAAECLRIKGLAVPDEDPALSPKKTHIPESRQSPSAKRARRESVPDASSNTALCSNQNHHSLSPSRSHSSTVSNTVPSQSVNSDTLSQVPSLSVPPVYTDKRHSSLSVNDSQKHTDQSDIVPIEMIKVEVDDENSNNSQLHRSKDRPIGQSGGKEDSRGEGSGNNNNIEESHRDRESISNNFSDYSAGNQSTDIEKEEHDQIDPFNESDQVAGPSGVQGGSQLVNWGEEEGSFPHNLFGNDDSSHQQVCIAIVEPEMLAVRMFQGSKSQYVVNHSQLHLTQGERNSEREKIIGQSQDIQQPMLSPSLHQHRGPEPHYVVYQPAVQPVDQFQKKNSENLHQLEILHSVPSSSIILSTPTISTSTPAVASQVISPSLQHSLPTISVMTQEKPFISNKKTVSPKKNTKPKTLVKKRMIERTNEVKLKKPQQKRKKKPELLLEALKGKLKNEKEKFFQRSHENLPLVSKIEIPTASEEVRPAKIEETNIDTSQYHLANEFAVVDGSPIQQKNHSPKKQDCSSTLNLSDSSSNSVSPQDLSSRHHRQHFCPYCQYHSKSKVDLNKHIRIHTREKPYKCSLCKYETGDKSNFKRHITCVHKCEYVSILNSAEPHHSSVPDQQLTPQANSNATERETSSSSSSATHEDFQSQQQQQHIPVILEPHQNVQERSVLVEHQPPLLGYSSVEIIQQHSDVSYSSSEIEQQPPPPPPPPPSSSSPQPIPSMQVHSVEICSPISYSHSITTTPNVSSSSSTP